MTRKDYKLIAEVLSDNKPTDDPDGYAKNTWATICEQFARELERTNSKFDSIKFLIACGNLT